VSGNFYDQHELLQIIVAPNSTQADKKVDLLITNTGACILSVWEESSRGEAEARPSTVLGYGKGMTSRDRYRVRSVKEFQTREVLQMDANKFRSH
jgi:hypothetical protein